MAARFQMVNNSTTDDAIYVLEDLGWLQGRIRYRMKVVRHDDIGVDRKPSRCSGFVKSGARDKSEGVGAKNRKPVLGYASEVECRSVS